MVRRFEVRKKTMKLFIVGVSVLLVFVGGNKLGQLGEREQWQKAVSELRYSVSAPEQRMPAYKTVRTPAELAMAIEQLPKKP